MSDLDTILFVAGSVPVTLGLALVAGIVVLLAIGVFLLVGSARANAQRAEEAAREASDNLRASFLEQIAHRDLRIRDLDAALVRERERADDLIESERIKNSELGAELAAMRTRLDEQARQNETNLKRF